MVMEEKCKTRVILDVPSRAFWIVNRHSKINGVINLPYRFLWFIEHFGKATSSVDRSKLFRLIATSLVVLIIFLNGVFLVIYTKPLSIEKP